MEVNLKDIYQRNILQVFGLDNKEAFRNAFSPKELSYWDLVMSLLENEPENPFWDSAKDRKWLEEYLEIFFLDPDATKFTLDEWFEYLSNR